MSDVVFVGRANIDLTVRIPFRPEPGHTVFGSELSATAGGKSLNQAIAVAHLGGRASLVANVGADHWGHHILATLTEADVDVTHLQLLAGVPTSAALIHVTPDGENHLVLAISPRTELTADQVQHALEHSNVDVIAVQLDLPPEPVTTVLTEPQPRALRIGNLIPHPSLDRSLMARLDILVVNHQEAAAMLGKTDITPMAAARLLRRLGPSAAIVTAGPHGAAYSHPDGSDIVDAPTTQVVDTTGAGDAFFGSLTLDLSQDTSLPDAVTRAVQVGAKAVQHEGAHLPTHRARPTE